MIKYIIFLSAFFSYASASIQNVSTLNNCVTAYEHADYKGFAWNFCPDEEANSRGWQNKISSIRVSKGYKVTLCRDKDKYGSPEGLCREYTDNTNWIGERVNDQYSYIKVKPVDKDSFDFIIASDTQYQYCVSSLCKNRPGNSYIANEWHSNSMKELAKDIGDKYFSGIIVNGDLTNTMDRKDIIQFEKDYSGIPVYPGLGNHDYQNYIDDKWCDGWYIEAGGYRAWAQNLCAARLVEWFVGRVKTIPASKNDIKVSGHRGKDISGSLAYSFDKYDWHFVQLNNKPGYTKRFTSYDSWIVRQRNIDIKDSYLWLKNDLNKNKNKNTVLNYHIFNNDNDNDNDNDNEMGTILDDNPQVVAIFAGHYHNMIGSGYLNNGNYYNYHNSRYYIRTPKGRIIPVFYSGSAENNIYLHATFKPKSLTVKPVSSVNGNYKYIGKENIINF